MFTNRPDKAYVRRRTLRRLSIVAGFVALLVGVWFSIHWLSVRSRINAEFERIRAAGEPANTEELEAFYDYPAEENDITALWLDAIAPLHEPAFWEAGKGVPFLDDDVDPPIVGGDWPEIRKAESLLEEYATTLTKLHAVAAMAGEARYSVDFQSGIEMLLSHVQKLRAAARLLQLEAHVSAHHGDVAGSCNAIRAILAAGHSLENEPVLVSFLVQTAIDRMALEELERLLGAVPITDTCLIQFRNELRAKQYQRGFHRALLGDRVVMAVSLHDEVIAQSKMPGAGWATWQLFGRDMVAVYLETMKEMVASSRLDWWEANARVRQIEDRLQEDTSFRQLMTALFIGSYRAALRAATNAVAESRACDTAIAVERFRRNEGKLPNRLAELMPEFLPEVLQDPFTHKPLRYVIEENGYVVYSVGVDGIDDGGVSDDHRGPDIVFRVSRPTAD